MDRKVDVPLSATMNNGSKLVNMLEVGFMWTL